MKPRAAALLATTLLWGCVYYNGIYNAEHLYREAERYRLAGDDSLADIRYEDVVRKAARGYRQDPEGPWAGQALYLLGRARLRLGELSAAQAALEEAEARSDDEQLRMGVAMHVGATLLDRGDNRGALQRLNRALQGLDPGPELAEAHLLRSRVLLAGDGADAGWWDLDRAAALNRDLRVAAAMDRIRWALELDQINRAREGARRLLSYPEAAFQRDSVVVLLRAVARVWGPDEVASLLAGADYAWGRMARGDALLARAELLFEAGDTAGARIQAEEVAGGFGEAAAEARILLARWTLEVARDLSTIEDARRTLLPAEEHPEVAEFLSALEQTEALAEGGLTEPLAWFAAAEVARDGLGAPVLARGLFLAYAAGAPNEPWVAKALLAALAVSREEGDRAWLRGRLESRADSPYVLAAHGASAPGFEVLEEELARRLDEIRSR